MGDGIAQTQHNDNDGVSMGMIEPKSPPKSPIWEPDSDSLLREYEADWNRDESELPYDLPLPMAGTHIIERRTHSQCNMFVITLAWLGYMSYFLTVSIIILPKQMLDMVDPTSKGTVLGLVFPLGAIVGVVVSPIFGGLSDKYTVPGFNPQTWGKRKPFMVIGTSGAILFLAVMAFFGETRVLSLFLLSYMLVSFCISVAAAPFSALIPDLVTPKQMGQASGWMGFMAMAGGVVGGVMGLLQAQFGGLPAVYIGIVGVLIITNMVTIFGTSESNQDRQMKTVTPIQDDTEIRQQTPMCSAIATKATAAARHVITPFYNRNFCWVYLTRFAVNMGIFSVNEFLQYYLTDMIGGPFEFLAVKFDRPEQAAAFFIIPFFGGTMLSSIVGGILSDKYGRKPIVYFSNCTLILVTVVFMVVRSYTTTVMAGLLFGLGFGGYMSVDFALVNDILPSNSDRAKDLAIWSSSIPLSKIIAPPITGSLLDLFQSIGKDNGVENLGYYVIYSIAAFWYLMGIVCVSRIAPLKHKGGVNEFVFSDEQGPVKLELEEISTDGNAM